MSTADFERFYAETPEAKLELIEGQLIVGNSLAGSRYMLCEILKGWGIGAALPMAPAELWWEALAAAFQPSPRPQSLAEWQTWAARSDFQPELAPAGPHEDDGHFVASRRLRDTLWRTADWRGFGKVIGGDYVMRLADNAFTPDVLLAGPARLASYTEWYLDGPADLAIEVMMPGHEAQDAEVKRRYYAAGGVPEYWLVNPAMQSVTFLRLRDGDYQPQPLDADGRYRPASVPGLVFVPERVWDPRSVHGFEQPAVFEVERSPSSPVREWKTQPSQVRWGSLPFEPQVALTPLPISCDQFLSWCPEAKFEGLGRWPYIGGRTGTRNVLGMLLMMFGLTEVVKVLPPREWVAGLAEAEEARRTDAQRRAEWWDLARKAADLLREEFDVERVAVTGDLLSPAPLNLWSEITLVVWEWPRKGPGNIYYALYQLSQEPVIDLIRAERTTSAQRQLMERGLVDL